MKKYSVSLYLLLISGLGHAEYHLPAFFDASYTIYNGDIKIGLMERSFKMAEGSNFLFRSESKATGFISLFMKDRIVEQSEWKMSAQGAIPLFYSYSHTGGKKNREAYITFNWDKNQIINAINGSTWRIKTQPGIQDKLLYQLTIMSDLKKGFVPESYLIADGGKIKNYYFKHLNDEIVDTPLGKFNTMKIERRKENSDRKTWLWCAYDLDFLPVKVEITEKKNGSTIALIKALEKYNQ